MNWYLEVLKKYAVFSGRARRKEFWLFALINCIIYFVIALIGIPAINYIYSLAVLLPTLAVGVRRMHDIGKNGWSILISLIPIVGAIIYLLWTVREGELGDNVYGEDPKALK